ncbi:MAG: D-glycero-beta-D-manno-heptose-7-phosphate kinase [Actinobacteria bacterium]|nr:MAG: D-glycero-beta-D-manno-heptose-7-phosphate kinase [Actinomycetota bacterium]
MDRGTIEAIARGFAGKRVVVLGDVMVDEFLRGTVDRISPEAPVPVLQFCEHTFVLGGAANVAHNVVALGGVPALVGVVGDDDAGSRLGEQLAAAGLAADDVVGVAGRRTTLKTRVLAHTQHVVRIDREELTPISGRVEKDVISRAQALIADADALLVSDYNKGTVTGAVAREAISAARKAGVPVVADTKHHRVKAFSRATLMTPNVREVEELSRVKVTNDSDLATAARTLIDEIDLEALLVTRAEEGMSLFGRDGDRVDVGAVATEVHDITGAGDTVAAALTLALAGGADLEGAARFANLAAAVVVRKLGTATASVDEVAALTSASGRDC